MCEVQPNIPEEKIEGVSLELFTKTSRPIIEQKFSSAGVSTLSQLLTIVMSSCAYLDAKKKAVHPVLSKRLTNSGVSATVENFRRNSFKVLAWYLKVFCWNSWPFMVNCVSF